MADNRSNLTLLPSGRVFNRTHLICGIPTDEGDYALFFVGGGQTRLTGDDAVAFRDWLRKAANDIKPDPVYQATMWEGTAAVKARVG